MRKVFLIGIIVLLFYSRFAGLDWGLPYPMHPDERNEAVAIQQLHCEISTLKECMNPSFFAYGQFPLYLGYFFVKVWHLIGARLGQEITFVEATMSLRFISALASMLTAFIMLSILKLFWDKKFRVSRFTFQIISLLVIIFSPFFIQFSHFGTTESLLMLFYTFIVYLCLRALSLNLTTSIILLGFVTGLAIATKISSISFAILPILTLIYLSFRSREYKRNLLRVMGYGLLTAITAVIFSPHNLINFQEFLGSIQYESMVGTGAYKAFYTRQFEHTVPVLFQITKIFPFALGLPQFVLFLIGFFLLPWKNTKINILRIAFLIYFVPTSFLYAKWTRFMAPVFPIATIFAVLALLRVGRFARFLVALGLAMMIIPGLAYLSIYQKPDVRFSASEWIYKNIPENSKILSETANVIDIPLVVHSSQLPVRRYEYTSFDFYNLDQNSELQLQLQQLLRDADYIFVPSRRLFKNNIQDYPLLDKYYQKLFLEELGFTKVAEFSSFPKVELFGKKLIEFPDEDSEETWTVFDHPVIRIYKRSSL